MNNDKLQMNWDMESIFPGGSSSPELRESMEQIQQDIRKLGDALKRMSDIGQGGATDDLKALMIKAQEIYAELSEAESFAWCLKAQDVADEEAAAIISKSTAYGADLGSILTDMDAHMTKISDPDWNKFLEEPELKPVAFYWSERRTIAKLKLSPELEKMAMKLAVDGYHGWSRLYDDTAGDLRVEFDDGVKTSTLSLGQLHSKFSSPDRDIRKQAYDKFDGAWKSVEPLTATTLNSLAGFRLGLYEKRGWDSPHFEPLMDGRMKSESLDAMWRAVESGLPKIEQYIAAKKKLLGIKNFRWYDQMAPLGDVNRTFSYDEAGEFIVEHLSKFSAGLGDFARHALDRRWVEAEDRPGKSGGGFCTSLPLSKETRIFMTFNGTYNDVMTLAHELGHSYHAWVLKDYDYFANMYTMTLAETASNFNELLVTDAAYNLMTTNSEKLWILDIKMQEAFIHFCNIRCRFIFETNFYKERKACTVSRGRLGDLMRDAQKKSFGNTLSDDGYHSRFWASKAHFYITDAPFYNFPYTVGFLLAEGIYDYGLKAEGSFAGKYSDLLCDTGVMSTEDVISKHLGKDLTTDEFWTNAVERVLEPVADFLKLAEKMS